MFVLIEARLGEIFLRNLIRKQKPNPVLFSEGDGVVQWRGKVV